MSERRRWWPLALLLLVPVLAFPGALPGPRVVSAHDHLTVHHAFQDAPGGRVHHPHLSDPALQFAALDRRVVSELRAGRVPLWNPDLYLGTDLLADGQSRVLSPVTLARVLLPEDAAQDVGVAFVLLWTGLGAALLAAALGLGPWAAAVAGAAAMTGPLPFVWLLHPHASTFAWLPWVLLAIEKRKGWAVALATFGLLCGGHPGTMVHAAMIASAWWLTRSRSVEVALGALVGALLSAPVLAPLAEAVQASATASARGHTPLLFRQLADLVRPHALGHPAKGTWSGPGSWADGQLHPGMVTLALAVFGSVKTKQGRALTLGWLACIGLAMAPLPGPVDHARLAQVGALLVALAAGFGAMALPGVRGRAPALALVLTSGLLPRGDDQRSLPADAHAPEPAAWTAVVRDAAGCGAEPGDCGRVLGLGWVLQPNTGALAGLRDVRGYDLPLHRDTWALMNTLQRPAKGPWFPVDALPPLPLLRQLGVRVVVTDPETTLPLDELALPTAPVRAWRVPDPLPRAWLAPRASVVPDQRAALDVLARGSAASPAVEGPLPVTSSLTDPAPVPVVEDGPARLVFTLPDGGGLLVTQTAWRPGWRARVDGQPATVVRVSGALCGVLVPPGARGAELFYRPDGWIHGQRLLLGGLAGLLLLLVTSPGRRRGRLTA